MPTSGTGAELLKLAQRHVGEEYRFGASVPKDATDHKGPWDCAEFASWLVFQVSGGLYGCLDDRAAAAIADAFTGAWSRDANALGRAIAVDEAAAIPGAMVLRAPGTAGIKVGHIVVSDGRGGTIEAHSTRLGVIAGSLDKRIWDTGVLVPGITYEPVSDPLPVAEPPMPVLRLTNPPMEGAAVKKVQRMLRRLGFSPGLADGVYGHQTVAAVQAFQIAKGLVVDGEVGRATMRALERVSASPTSTATQIRTAAHRYRNQLSRRIHLHR
jgi:N-acetylmuramoyl-L-alanine amidase